MSAKLAELIGVLLGDGSIGIYDCVVNGKLKKHYRIKITLNSTDDRDYAIYLKMQIEHLLGTTPIMRKRPNENTLDLFIFKRRIIRNLIQMGLRTAPKWNRARVPQEFLSLKSLPALLRGYMDTDGCVTVANNNGIRYPRIEMKICPSPMQKQLILGLRRLGFSPRVYSIGRGKVRVVLAGTANLRKWNERIGFSNAKNISRYESFKKIQE
ncbi:MAG: LAGLIDADG family homing endonuclease [Candidatus Micrarchaeia archaeon]